MRKHPYVLHTLLLLCLGVCSLQANSQQNATTLGADPSHQDGYYTVDGRVLPPQLTKQVDAKFSKEAKKQHQSGKVIVKHIVNVAGQPEQVAVLRGVGYGLDEEASKAVQQYRFRPATLDGHAVPVRINIEVKFVLIDR